MINQTTLIEFITPAFLTGANQNSAELRIPSIRGELRWWFRALGGSVATERCVFGGVGCSPASSKIVLRLESLIPKHEHLPSINPLSDLGYIYYFATVSGKKEGIDRVQRNAHFAPGTQFCIRIIERYQMEDSERTLVRLAIDAMWRLGALGLRATRGCGAMCESNNLMTQNQLAEWVKTMPDQIWVKRSNMEVFPSWNKCQESLGYYLRELRRTIGLSGKERSSLGFSESRARLSSALRLRPVKVKEGYLSLLVYTDIASTQPSILGKLRGYEIGC